MSDGSVRLREKRQGVEIEWNVAPQDAFKKVMVVATGAEGDVHNKARQPNNGQAGVFYPDGFKGTSLIEIKDEDGNVLDSGSITIE